jgi:hypothetical protein
VVVVKVEEEVVGGWRAVRKGEEDQHSPPRAMLPMQMAVIAAHICSISGSTGAHLRDVNMGWPCCRRRCRLRCRCCRMLHDRVLSFTAAARHHGQDPV